MRVFITLSLMVTLALAGVSGSVARAEAPRVSLRPMPRVLSTQTAKITPVMVYYRAKIRPKPRRQFNGYGTRYVATTPIETTGATVTRTGGGGTYALASTAPVFRSPRPMERPAGLRHKTSRTSYMAVGNKPVRVASTKPTAISRAGSLCGDPRIKGEVLAPIAGKIAGCGVDKPVRVSSIDGVVLSQASIMDCTTAKTLRGWVTNSLKPAVRFRGGGVKSLRVPSHYACRTRNSQPGAKISEHGKGHAIDISAINFKDGSQLTVLDGWKNRQDKKILKKLHAAACGPFGTVLGPEANRFHLDHFHFDTARYRSGSYCE